MRPSTRNVAVAWVVVSACVARAQDPRLSPAPSPTTGVLRRTDQAAPGFTLFAPFNSGETLLVDLDGRVVHSWRSEFPPGGAVELLPDGHLLRAAFDPGRSRFRAGGAGGRLEEFDWDGRLVWTYVCCDFDRRQHHGFARLPDGDVLLIAWESKTREEVLAAGRDAVAARDGLWPDCILEVRPTRPVGGEIVWEWHVFDHLVQDRDVSLPGFGVVADHPELIDVNAGRPAPSAPAATLSPAQRRQLEQLGYLAAEHDEASDDPRDAAHGRARPSASSAPKIHSPGVIESAGDDDWNHLNSVAYNRERDEILLSSHHQNEIWIIDHGTTKEEAAGHSGGRRGHGGDLLYRWGNPAMWHRGAAADQQLFGQHDARWIEPGLRGAGHVLVFNNHARERSGPNSPRPRGGDGAGTPARRESPRSDVVELELPIAADGDYFRSADESFRPAAPLWSYGAGATDVRFASPVVSGSQRLENGDTLISSGAEGHCIEVTGKNEVAWEFRCPNDLAHAIASRQGAGEAPGVRFFRAVRIPAGAPALVGRVLTPVPKGD